MKKLFLICLAIFIILLLLMVKIAFSETIDVGCAEVINRDSTDGAGYSTVLEENPANATGTIDHIEIYIGSAGDIEIASFYKTNGNIFSTRGYTGALTCVVGFNEFDAPEDFTAFDINEGDYIGGYWVSATVDRDSTGSFGKWTSWGDKVPCTDWTGTYYTPRTVSLYATGSTGEAPPTAKPVQSHTILLE